MTRDTYANPTRPSHFLNIFFFAIAIFFIVGLTQAEPLFADSSAFMGSATVAQMEKTVPTDDGISPREISVASAK